MAIHYNAFISYRHHPDDIKVASEIHRSLERFHVPKAIRKRTGKIERLFRDKEELPITSNLSDDIDLALTNSDYLIVICSVHTKESVWVQREIQLFLKTHDRDHVLTVLASGEPYDVIPEILLYEDSVDPVTGEVTRTEFEPLSCDWRMKLSKAKREELPRLAAALLGCGYDELRQRQKQYRTRRLIAAVSSVAVASTCLAAYFLHTSITIARANEQIRQANIQIQKNLEEALTNQSRHLATAARERLTEGDRLTALSLAVAALPSQDNVRPYVAEAENVLTDALGIYNTVNQLSAVGTICPAQNVQIENFWVSPSEKYLYVADNRDVLTCWDLESLTRTGEYSFSGGYVSGLIMLTDDNVVVQGGESSRNLTCLTPKGEVLWQRDDCKDLQLRQDGMLLLLRYKDLSEVGVAVLDPRTGEILGEEHTLSAPLSGPSPSAFPVKGLPEDLPVLIRYFDFKVQELYTLDMETGELLPLDLGTCYPSGGKVSEEGKLVFLGDDRGLGIGGLIENNRVNTPEIRSVYCYDIHTGEKLWENEITASVPGSMNLEFLPQGRILCQLGNVFQVMDMETGEVLSSCDAGSGVLSLAVGQNNATALLQDGYVCYYWFDAGYTYEVKCAQNGVTMGRIGEGLYLQHENGDHVTVLRTMTAQPEWVVPMVLDTSFQLQIVRDNYLACRDIDYVYLLDLKKQELLWVGERNSGELMGFSEDGSILYYTMGPDILVTLDIAAGEAEGSALPEAEGYSYYEGALLRNDQLYYGILGSEGEKLVRLDLQSGESQMWDVARPESAADLTGTWYVLEAQGDRVWMWGCGQLLVELDLQSGETRVLDEETDQKPVVLADPAGEWVAVANRRGITLTDSAGEERFLSLDDASAGSLCFRDGELLALCNNGLMYRFGPDGQVLSRTELAVNYDFASRLIAQDADPRAVLWQFTPGGKLVINLRGSGSVVDCGSWGMTASVSDFLVWDAESDTLVCKLTDCLGGFPLYTTDELLEMARQELGSFTLTREQQAAYGID